MVQLTISTIGIKDGTISLESWLQDIAIKYGIENISLLRQAGSLAQIAGVENAAPNGESCLHQGLTMTEILAELNLDSETLAAAMVYSSVRYAGLNLEDVAEHLGNKVAQLVKGTLQMEAINILHGENYHAHEPANIDNIRKMLLAMVDDVSVVLIKLAERLCILRNVAIFNEAKKKYVAKETMDIYAPLANRLGIGQLKWQLEDLSFRYLEPDEYKHISTTLNERRVDRDHYIQRMITELTQLLQKSNLRNFRISGRAKHIYSIFRKMQLKKKDIKNLYDISAVRILVPTIEDCYAALSSVHAHWQPVPKEFDDYIATPKANGYRSIHTAVLGPDNKYVEIQIRTFQMHEEAELGVAAHWIYKEGSIRKPSSYEEKIAWLRQVMDWQKEVATTEAAKTEIQTELFDDRTYELNTGEQVEILTTKEGQPSRDWLNPHLGYLKSSRARAKVLQWFKKQDYEKNLAEGQAQIEKEQRRLGIKTIDFDQVAQELNYKTGDDLLAALGRGDLGITTLINAIQSPEENSAIALKPEITRTKLSESLTDIDIHGVGNLLTHIALCCKPVPGDNIMGYVTVGRGISIHRQDCPNILRHQKTHDERLIVVNWGNKIHKNYPVDLAIQAQDYPNLNRDLTTVLTNENVPIIRMSNHVSKDDNSIYVSLTIEISSLAPLSKVLARISQLPNVYEVKRIS
jgi:GTP pyrophosphokinase